MKVSIFGLGYVGAVTAACFAKEGHHVLGVDVDVTKLNMIRSGQSPIIEEGLSECIRDGVASHLLQVTDDAAKATKEADVLLICVGTPSRPDGSLDLTVVCEVISQIGCFLRDATKRHLIIVRSTLLPGTINNVLIPLLEKSSGLKVDRDFDICFNPEFLREGTSLKDFYNPPFTVIGARSPAAAEKIRPLYDMIQAPYLITTVEAAEMIKCTCNTFHALKIAFANEVGALCKAMHVDSHEVMNVFCEDSKLNVSPAYLKPGFAFGGSCLPKDLRALEHQSRILGQETPVIQSILRSNAEHIERAILMILGTKKRDVGLLGLSFKAGTDDLRESPLVILAERLLGKGLNLSIYDENVSLAKLIGANKRYIEKEIPHLSRLLTSSLEDLFQKTELIVVGNKTPEYEDALQRYGTARHTIIDLVRIAKNSVNAAFDYRGICW